MIVWNPKPAAFRGKLKNLWRCRGQDMNHLKTQVNAFVALNVCLEATIKTRCSRTSFNVGDCAVLVKLEEDDHHNHQGRQVLSAVHTADTNLLQFRFYCCSSPSYYFTLMSAYREQTNINLKNRLRTFKHTCKLNIKRHVFTRMQRGQTVSSPNPPSLCCPLAVPL